MVGSDVAGTGDAGDCVAATELADGGAAAARSDSGVATVEGNVGAEGAAGVDSARTVAFCGKLSFFFQKAQRGPDWQPTNTASAQVRQKQLVSSRVFMSRSDECPTVV